MPHTQEMQTLDDFYNAKYGPQRDIVATQGRYLVSGPSSPVFHFDSYFNVTFYGKVVEALYILKDRMEMRHELYSDEAKESRVSHTPPELRALHQSQEEQSLRDFIYTIDAGTPSASGFCVSKPPKVEITHAMTPSPVCYLDSNFNATFYEKVVDALRVLKLRMLLRPQLYGDKAEESRVSHTPSEIRELHSQADGRFISRRHIIYRTEAPTPSTDGSVNSTPGDFKSEQTQATTPCTPSPDNAVRVVLPKEVSISVAADANTSGRKRKRMEDVGCADIKV